MSPYRTCCPTFIRALESPGLRGTPVPHEEVASRRLRLNRRNPLFSHIELAAQPGSDGRLEVHDVYGLPLDARLVVLSACRTGVGSGLLADVPAGDEWVGLVQAFLTAGAARVVATLWLVDDRATAELMTQFHAARRTATSDAAALADVQRRAIAGSRHGDPYFWAGIQLIGGL